MPSGVMAQTPTPYPALIRELVRDEAITHGLGDIEARMLVDWAVGWAELLSEAAPNLDRATELVQRVRRRAGTVGKFVRLWGHLHSRAAACQLAAVERVVWPLPSGAMDPADLMQILLEWERPGESWEVGYFGTSGQEYGPQAS